MPLSPTFFVGSPPSSFSSSCRFNNNHNDFTPSSVSNIGLPECSTRSFEPNSFNPFTSNSSRRPPLPPNQFRTRPLNKLAVIKPNQPARIMSRSPSPNLSSATRSCRSMTPSNRTSRSSSNSSMYSRMSDSGSIPRRFYPQSSPNTDKNSELKELSSKEQAPVIFDASLNFVLGIEKQKVRQSFRPTASHLEPTTASSLLSSKIAHFLQRTDHIMEEWRSLGHNDDTGDLANLTSLPHNDRHRRLGRSKSATNIMIKGFQYYSRANSVAKSPTGSIARLSCLEEDKTISECYDDEVV